MRLALLCLSIMIFALGCSESRPEAKPGAVDTAADPLKVDMLPKTPAGGSGTKP